MQGNFTYVTSFSIKKLKRIHIAFPEKINTTFIHVKNYGE